MTNIFQSSVYNNMAHLCPEYTFHTKCLEILDKIQKDNFRYRWKFPKYVGAGKCVNTLVQCKIFPEVQT